jgi:hypothetical protein
MAPAAEGKPPYGPCPWGCGKLIDASVRVSFDKHKDACPELQRNLEENGELERQSEEQGQGVRPFEIDEAERKVIPASGAMLHQPPASSPVDPGEPAAISCPWGCGDR